MIACKDCKFVLVKNGMSYCKHEKNKIIKNHPIRGREKFSPEIVHHKLNINNDCPLFEQKEAPRTSFWKAIFGGK